MSKLIPNLAAIETTPPLAEAVTAIFAGAVNDVHDIVITGADALNWYAPAISSEDLVFAVWPDPKASIVVYAGADHERVGECLANGTLVLVAGGGLGPDIPYVVQSRVATTTEVTDFFGLDRVVVSSEEPVTAAVRRLGPPEDAAELLCILGATVTIYAGASTVIAQSLAGHVLSSLTLRQTERDGPNMITRVPWTRALGSFQLRHDDSLHGVNEVIGGSVGPIATIVGRSDVETRISAILDGEAGLYDVVAAAQPGGATTFVTDVALAFADVGPVVLTGNAVPPRTVVVLRGPAAAAARPHLQPSPFDQRDADAPKTLEPIIIGPPPAEDRERFITHQWASAQHRAKEAQTDDWPHGGPTLLSESRSIGLIDQSIEEGDESEVIQVNDMREATLVDGATVELIAYTRSWHIIDPTLPPVLDAVLSEARHQISGDDTSITADHLSQLRSWGSQPGFWSDLPSATLPAAEGVDDLIVFPYPPTAVDLLRAIVAANGDAVELRRLLGPIKVAVMTALGPKIRQSDSEGGESYG